MYAVANFIERNFGKNNKKTTFSFDVSFSVKLLIGISSRRVLAIVFVIKEKINFH